jgi:hypothetical protein
VDDAPDGGPSFAFAVREAEVRVADAVLAQVLAGAGDDDDVGAALRQPRRGALGEVHRPRHRERGRRPRLARAPGHRCRRDEGEGDADGGMQPAAHRVILSL